MLKITGRVSVQETGEGLSGLHVKGVDKDLLFDDVLGTAVTDSDGRFEITYEKKDFAELFETAPDLYVVVRDAQNQRTLYSSEDSVRCNASAEEIVNIAIPRSVFDEASGLARPPYGPKRGTVKIRFDAVSPPEVKLLFTEHRSENRKQHVVTGKGKEVSVELPSGEYTMQILVRGFETIRGLATVDPKKPFAVDAVLKPRKKQTRTFEERLTKYGIDASKTEIGELNVPAETTRALNHETDPDKRGFKMLHADTIADVKGWLGSDDAKFGHDRPVFGPLPEAKQLSRLRDAGVDLRQLDPDEVKAVTAIAREYVEGNSKAVALYEPVLNQALKASLDASRIPLYYYRIVTIAAGATLEIGNGSAIFACDELRIHKTGKLKPVKSVSIEIGTYTEFQ
jgi:hypothetical protein